MIIKLPGVPRAAKTPCSFFFLLTFFIVFHPHSRCCLLSIHLHLGPWSATPNVCVFLTQLPFFFLFLFLPLSVCIFPHAVLPSNCGILQEHIFTQMDSYTHIFLSNTFVKGCLPHCTVCPHFLRVLPRHGVVSVYCMRTGM